MFYLLETEKFEHSLWTIFSFNYFTNNQKQMMFSFQNDIFTVESYINGSWTPVATWAAAHQFNWTEQHHEMKFDF